MVVVNCGVTVSSLQHSVDAEISDRIVSRYDNATDFCVTVPQTMEYVVAGTSSVRLTVAELFEAKVNLPCDITAANDDGLVDRAVSYGDHAAQYTNT